MSRQIVLALSLLIAVSTALKCNTCVNFPSSTLTEAQQKALDAGLTTLKLVKCDGATDQSATCESAQDECQKVEISSKIGGTEEHEGSVLACGTKSLQAAVCPAFTTNALKVSLVIEDCEVEACAKDNCFKNAGISHQYSMYTLIVSAVAYFLVSL